MPASTSRLGRRRGHRLAIAGVLGSLGLGLAACGDDDATASASAGSGSASAVEAEAGTDAAVDTELADIPDGRGVVTENADGTRTVTSAWGTATVPAEPQRIVSVLGYIDFETMLALGERPLAAGTQGGTVESGFAPHVEGLTDGIEPLAWADGAPAETIAALQPDLIFVPDEDTAHLLADIAPTVPAGAAEGLEWKDDFTYIAAVLGLGEDAQQLLDDYEADAERLRTALEPVIAGRTVASPQVAHDHTQVYVDRADAFSSAVLTELGFTLAPITATSSDDPIAISFERLPEIDADIVFWQVRQDDDGARDVAGLQAATDSPLWSQVPAVAAGQLFEVENRPWYFPTILAARQILADVEGALL